ncbi:Unknown protein [Striga hermonthica]|uniref:DUF4283 domain-containing protein n=1 Tax=Striga hermonthica TaxID=68872 RepID=A0A9N7P2S6_STRHE|nr:Unknown protein [Striga hermonthica]
MAEDLSAKFEACQLSEQESTIIPIESADIAQSAEDCNTSLLGKIVGQKRASLIGIKRAVNQMWKTNAPVMVREISPNFFQFLFSDNLDKIKVLKGLNWTFENQILILKEWALDLSSNHPIFNDLEIWVQVWNLPLNWFSTDVGLKLGKIFKQVLDVNVPSRGLLAGKCIRLKVIMDAMQPLIRCANLQMGDKKILAQFIYERLTNFCFYCG